MNGKFKNEDDEQVPIRATYRIRTWAHWDRKIDEAVADFRGTHQFR